MTFDCAVSMIHSIAYLDSQRGAFLPFSFKVVESDSGNSKSVVVEIVIKLQRTYGDRVGISGQETFRIGSQLSASM